jgi:hypothetical protein
MKTSELTGAALNWAVAMCEGWNLTTASDKTGSYPWLVKAGKDIDLKKYRPSTNWMQGGPIIQREKIEIFIRDEEWFAYSSLSTPEDFPGDTPLIAAMRCYVASQLGDTIDIPEELA